jgi:hypothetical protein
METKDIAELFVTATGKIEFYWNFYTVTALALIGWLVSTKKALAPRVKVLITAGYLAFVLMNVIGLYGAYTFAEALREDLLLSAKATPDILQNAQEVLSRRSFEGQKKLVFAIHVLVGAFVLFAVWFGRLGEDFSGDEERPNKAKPADAENRRG